MIEFDEKFWLALSFIILFSVLFKRIKAYFKNFFERRTKNIESKLLEAVAIREKAETVLSLYKDKERTIKPMVDNIIKEAENHAKYLINAANEEISILRQRKIVSMKVKINNYQNQVLSDIRSKAISLSVKVLKDFIKNSSTDKFLTNINNISIKNLNNL